MICTNATCVCVCSRTFYVWSRYAYDVHIRCRCFDIVSSSAHFVMHACGVSAPAFTFFWSTNCNAIAAREPHKAVVSSIRIDIC